MVAGSGTGSSVTAVTPKTTRGHHATTATATTAGRSATARHDVTDTRHVTRQYPVETRVTHARNNDADDTDDEITWTDLVMETGQWNWL